MTVFRKIFLTLLGAAMIAALAACQSSEERAEEHYQNALELLEEGDFTRAQIEFRNVFQHNGNHRDARATYAALLRERGEFEEAYSQYLRLVEQYTDDAEGRIALAEMALVSGNPEEAERHGRHAIELAPDDPRTATIELNLDYIRAYLDGDVPARRDAADRARAALEEDPDNRLLLRVLIDDALLEGDLDTALATVDAALLREPESRTFHDLRLALLAELGRAEEVEAQLLDMIARYPGEGALVQTLMRYYLGTGQPAAAIAFLRDQAAGASDPQMREGLLASLVRLRLETEGPDAALEELERIVAEADGPAPTFLTLRASIRFDQGDSEAAIDELEAMLEETLVPEDEARGRVVLARMLNASGNVVGARAQVERVLEADQGNVEALKMRAGWLIDGDETDRAIALLRTALDNAPGDVEALTLMARAHDRNGDRELAREFLSLAVEASNAAPAESLRYATALVEADRLLAAEETLIDALRLAPDHDGLMIALGELYIRMEDWSRAEQVETTLRGSGDAERMRAADELQAARLAAQDRLADAIGLIESIAEGSGLDDVRAQIAVVRARLAGGDLDGALSYAESLVADAPEVPDYRLALAAVQNAVGDVEAAEASFRTLTEQFPDLQQAWIGLVRVLNGQGREDEARAVLGQALEVLPDALNLLWAQASFRESAGDYEGAIEIYEMMYERAPDAPVIANNLASLLSTYREDAESLDRAWTVARRLRGSDVPPFQDTYGWIAYRRGDYEAALEHLEPAAAALPGDPLVQYHLGMTYVALDRPEDALAQLRRAVEIAGPDDPRPQFPAARSEIARLEAEAAEEAGQ